MVRKSRSDEEQQLVDEQNLRALQATKFYKSGEHQYSVRFDIETCGFILKLNEDSITLPATLIGNLGAQLLSNDAILRLLGLIGDDA